MGRVVQFPRRARRQFTAEMRGRLAHFAATVPSFQPLVFGEDGDGSEFCCFANGFMVGWDRWQRLVLTDTLSGYVDRGPFDDLDEICLLIIYLTA
jgi:hypothetical protein